MPNSFFETEDGDLFIASGFDPMVYWDSFSYMAKVIGLAAPTQAPAIASSGLGTWTGQPPNQVPVGIIGQYTAYLRFLDINGNPSNLSPLWNQIDTTIDPSTGQKYVNTFLQYAAQITYTNVQVPTDPTVVRRQLLRSTAGQTNTYYVDIDTDDCTSTTFTSTLDDANLSNQTAVPILDNNGGVLANQYGIPPNWKAVLVEQQGRMFAAVEYSYTQGSVQVEFGTDTVQGVGTEWTSSMVNRYLYVVGAYQSYQIQAVDPVNQILTLTSTYIDASNLFAEYAIRPPPAERRLVYYSQPGLPFAWPPENAVGIQEDGDELTGLMPKTSFLYILERDHIYRLTFSQDPATDGFIFLAANRGCLNQRCWAIAEDMAYMLDYRGLHSFSSGGETQPISTLIQELFRTNLLGFGINWGRTDFFHAAHFPPQETIRWFVCMTGQFLPRHAICYNYRQKRWWIEEYRVPICSSALGYLAGQQQTYLGSDDGRIFALWQGTLDGPHPDQGTVTGSVASAGLDWLTDLNASYASQNLVGNPISIISGRGEGQTRIVASISGQTIFVTQPWLIQPDDTSEYLLGGIPWSWQCGWLQFVVLDETLTERRFAFVFEPVEHAAIMTVHLFVDFNPEPYAWNYTISPEDQKGIGSVKDSPDLSVDLTKPSGYADRRFPGHREFSTDGARYMSLQCSGYGGLEQHKLYMVSIDGVTT